MITMKTFAPNKSRQVIMWCGTFTTVPSGTSESNLLLARVHTGASIHFRSRHAIKKKTLFKINSAVQSKSSMIGYLEQHGVRAILRNSR